MQSYDGLISQEDLKAYESVWREPYEVIFEDIACTLCRRRALEVLPWGKFYG